MADGRARLTALRARFRGGRPAALSAALSSRMLAGIIVVALTVVVVVSGLAALSAAWRPAPLSPAPSSPAGTASATGTPDPHSLAWVDALHEQAQVAYVNDIIAHMSIDEEIGQMLVSEFNGTSYSADIATKIQQYHVGGLIFYLYNVVSAQQLRTMTQHMQQASHIPLFIAIDQEGGTVDRLRAADRPHPSAESVGDTNDPNYARAQGQEVGAFMASVGLNQNFAPVVDVQNVPDSATYMATRMYAWTPDKVATMAGAYLDGLQSGGKVVGTLKHFPGMGNVPGDPHQTAVVLTRSLADLNAIDWAPYKTLIASGQVNIIMTTHLVVNAVDPSQPTTTSYKVTTGILRDQLGFQGVIMTDDVGMASLADYYPAIGDRVVHAVLAGNDLICSLYSQARLEMGVSALKAALASGEISKSRIDDSVRRILLLKLRYGVLSMPSH